MTSYILLLLIGLLAGALGSVLGLGGGVIMLPAVQIFLSFDAVMAVGTTLLAVVFTSLSGAWGHFRAGNVQVKSGLWVGLGGLMGVLAGSFVFKQYLSTSTEILTYVLGALFTVMTIKMGLETYADLQALRREGEIEPESERPFRESVLGLMGLGMFTGTLTGMLGIGGGFIMLPGMMWFFGVPAQVAVGTTLLAMLPIAIVGASIKMAQGFVFLGAGLTLGLGTALGAQLGVYVSKYLSALILKALFTLVFLILAIDYLYPLVRFLP